MWGHFFNSPLQLIIYPCVWVFFMHRYCFYFSFLMILNDTGSEFNYAIDISYCYIRGIVDSHNYRYYPFTYLILNFIPDASAFWDPTKCDFPKQQVTNYYYLLLNDSLFWIFFSFVYFFQLIKMKDLEVYWYA